MADECLLKLHRNGGGTNKTHRMLKKQKTNLEAITEEPVGYESTAYGEILVRSHWLSTYIYIGCIYVYIYIYIWARPAKIVCKVEERSYSYNKAGIGFPQRVILKR